MSIFFIASVIVLAALLYFPVGKLIWVLSVRRLQRKLKRELSPGEINGQKNRSRFVTIPLVTLFSWFFNLQILGTPHG